MATAHDVAAFILERAGAMTAMKLQKLTYYSQAWHLVWDEAPLFTDRIEAWANGPVVRSLYAHHRGQFVVDKWPLGDSSKLSAGEEATVLSVIGFYGAMSAHELSELTHREDPWRLARNGLAPGARADSEISHASMHEYYDSLTSSTQ